MATPSTLVKLLELAKLMTSIRALPCGFVGNFADREVRVEHAHGLAVDWIVVRTPICPAFDMAPEPILERNACLAFATIALSKGTYWLRVAVPCDSSELADPARLLQLVTEAAASLAPRSKVTVDSHVFDHFTS